MVLLKRITQPFKRLRWKLTLSYATVTAGALIITALILAIIFFSFILAPHEYIPKEFWVNIFLENISPAWRYILSQDPIDTDLLNLIIQSGFGENQDFQVSYYDVLRFNDLQITARMMGKASILIVSPDLTLLGASNHHWVTQEAIGQPLDLNLLPNLADPLNAALSGSSQPEQVFQDIEPYDQFYFVLPIFADPELEHQVLAAAVIFVESLPTESDTTANVSSLILRSSLIFLLAASLIGTAFGFLTTRGMVQRFGIISKRTDAWSQGDFSDFINDSVGDEISQLSLRLNHMAEQLQDLLKTNQELAVSEERNRLARDLHDSAKQEALAASFHLGTALTLFDQDPVSAKNHIREADNLVDSVRRELTDLIHELRPPSIDGDNYDDTIQEYLMEWAHQTGIQTEIIINGSSTLPLEIKLSIYRILQEALANIARHSSANQVQVKLKYLREQIMLDICDDGVGFDIHQHFNGIGLESMRERAEALGGNFQIVSSERQGTSVQVSFPVSHKRE